jgi:hypothetical protein
MTKYYPATRQLLLYAGALMTSACQLSVDDKLVRDLPEDASTEVACPEGYVCRPVGSEEPDSGDEGPEASAPTSRRDAGTDPSPSPVEKDAGHAAVACNEDGHCGADGFCSTSGTCTPRCSQGRGCVIANTGRLSVTSMMRVPDGVLYATQTTWDALGNNRYDGAIWLLKQNGTSTKLVTGLDYGRIVLVADGQIYLTQHDHNNPSMEANLQQAPLSGGTFQPVQVGGAGVRTVVASSGYLWWQRATTASDMFELWRRARSTGAQDEKVKDVRGQALLAATDSAVYYSFEPAFLKSDLMVDDLTGATPRLINRADFTWSEAVLFKDRIVGTTFYGAPVRWFSFPTSGVGPVLNIVPQPPEYDSSSGATLVYDEPWVYWGQSFSDADSRWHLRLGRSEAQLAFEPEVLTDIVTDQSPLFTLAPWPDELVYFTRAEQRLFRLPIPAPRCSAAVACPAGKTCQPDKTCH